VSTTRENLIYATIELMLRNGYHAVSVDEICAWANVKKGSFYHFFDSKTNLTLQAMDHHYQESKSVCDGIFFSTFSPIERFQNFFEYIYRTQADLHEKLGHVCGALSVTLGSEMVCHDDIRKKASEIIRSYEKYYECALADLVSSGEIRADTNIENTSSNISCYIIGKVTIARIRNSLDFLKDFNAGVFQIAGMRSSKHDALQEKNF